MRKSNIKVLLTGGHAATTAYAVLEELLRREGKKYTWDIYWIGVQKAVEGSVAETLESRIFTNNRVQKHTIIAGRLQRKFSIWTIPSAAKIPLGFIQAFVLLLRIRPDVILSFGGFAALPVVIAGFVLRVSVVLHDQTGGIGRANKLSLPFATKIAVARSSALNNGAPKGKTVVTGNPIMTRITQVPIKVKIGNPPTIFILGGSRGSLYLNEVIINSIEKLTERYSVIHQAGLLGFRKCNQHRLKLNKAIRDRYELYRTIDPMQIDGVFKRSDIMIARAGANTVSEIMAVKIPSILIPLPISASYDQPFNAELAKDFGIAQILNQRDLTPSKLINMIEEIEKNWSDMIAKVRNKKSNDLLAARRVVKLLEDLLPN